MTETIYCRGGCGFRGDKSQLHYEPEGKGAYRKEEYYCDKCHEKRFKLKKLLAAKKNYARSLTNQRLFKH
ncbi:hypothetical protein CG651_000461 [Salmonella enterica]|nr:hypothetical protein [Salmonella enterica]